MFSSLAAALAATRPADAVGIELLSGGQYTFVTEVDLVEAEWHCVDDQQVVVWF
jgi:hypothetical protein